jgi:hypothetical protein
MKEIVGCVPFCDIRYPCVDFAWGSWIDNGVEGNNSCIRISNGAAMDWASAASYCTSMVPGAHLLSTRQVGCCPVQLSAEWGG